MPFRQLGDLGVLRGVLESGVVEEARIRGFASPAFAGYAFVEWDDGLVQLHSRMSHPACQDALCPFHDDRPCQNFKRRLGTRRVLEQSRNNRDKSAARSIAGGHMLSKCCDEATMLKVRSLR